MLNNNAVSEHYAHGELLSSIKAALGKLGKTVDNVSVDDLGPVDEFHIGGRLATENFLSKLNFSEQDHILDVGCGLGGAARFVASKYNANVTGIDLTHEYIQTGNALSTWVGLEKQITLKHGNALSMSFKNNSFDGAYMLHVGMNIENKSRLFSEVSRLLGPGSIFGIYDIMRNLDGELTYPVPWASEHDTNQLDTPAQYKQALNKAGFNVISENDCRDFALNFFKELQAKTKANGGPPPLGLHTLMRESTPVKLKNMVDGIAANYISPVEIIARKK